MFVLLSKNMLPKSSAYVNIRIIPSFFLNREYIFRSVHKELEVIKLAFSNFL